MIDQILAKLGLVRLEVYVEELQYRQKVEAELHFCKEMNAVNQAALDRLMKQLREQAYSSERMVVEVLGDD